MEEPAERPSWAPLSGFISTQQTVVPSGILRSGNTLPGAISAAGPELIVAPDLEPLGSDHT